MSTNKSSVMALVEYLTSERAGQPLGDGFAWPLGMVVKSSAGKAEKINDHVDGHVNGHGNGHANGYSNGHTNGKALNGKAANGFSRNEKVE
jgi:dihydroceramidase